MVLTPLSVNHNRFVQEPIKIVLSFLHLQMERFADQIQQNVSMETYVFREYAFQEDFYQMEHPVVLLQ